MNKDRIIKDIVTHLEATIKDINTAYQANAGAADIDEESVLDKEDYSHQNEATDMKLAFKEKLIHAKNELNFVQGHAEQSFTEAKPGAIIQSDHEVFYLGIAFKSFEMEGIKVFGVSQEAPIYYELMDKREGDTFEINGQQHIIKSIS